MVDTEKVMQAIFAAIEEVNEQRPPERQIEPAADTVLFGQSGVLDSLGLVNLIVAAEQQLEEAFGASLTLADEKAMSQKHSPFRTVRTLAEYAATLLSEDG